MLQGVSFIGGMRPQLSWDIPTNAGFVCDKAGVLVLAKKISVMSFQCSVQDTSRLKLVLI
jgi:hypothetical protein